MIKLFKSFTITATILLMVAAINNSNVGDLAKMPVDSESIQILKEYTKIKKEDSSNDISETYKTLKFENISNTNNEEKSYKKIELDEETRKEVIDLINKIDTDIREVENMMNSILNKH